MRSLRSFAAIHFNCGFTALSSRSIALHCRPAVLAEFQDQTALVFGCPWWKNHKWRFGSPKGESATRFSMTAVFIPTICVGGEASYAGWGEDARKKGVAHGRTFSSH